MAKEIVPTSKPSALIDVIAQAGGAPAPTPKPAIITGTSGASTPAPAIDAKLVTTAIASDQASNQRTAQTMPIIIPAATTMNGQVVPAEIPLVATGNVFYIRAANGNLSIVPFRGGATGTENDFGVGQGREVSNGFENLSVKNYNLFPVVGLLWVGWDNFINNQLIIDQANQPAICFPTYPIANALSSLNITDRSGSAIQDVNGKTWLALYRIAIQIFNLDPGSTQLLFKLGGTTGSPAVAQIPSSPLPIRLDMAGNFTINYGAPINMIVSELYACIDPNQ